MKGRGLAIAVAAALGACAAAWAQDASITGRVTDARGESGLPGAIITIVELGRSTSSDPQGRYRFGALPDGRYTLRVSFVGADPVEQEISVSGGQLLSQDLRIGDDVARLNNVLIVGQAAGQASAINRQRASVNLVNVISSDAVGQLPDQNVAEALQRVPGVSITRDQGEGRFVTIRGIDSNLNA
ncbi:MAG: carboxypeptidase-like regulatory domain-containing protein, partial [Pseudomonadota bacterium]